MSFIKKLIKALNNPEPQTPIRAAKILGGLKCQESIPFLLEKLEKESDPFIIESLVKALFQIEKSNTKQKVLELFKSNTPVTIKNLLKELEEESNA